MGTFEAGRPCDAREFSRFSIRSSSSLHSSRSRPQRVHHFFGAAERGTTRRHHGAIGRLNLRPMLDRLSPLLFREGTRAVKRYKMVEIARVRASLRIST